MKKIALLALFTGAACIAFGASGLTLDLNGFTMTGLADPAKACVGTTPPGGVKAPGNDATVGTDCQRVVPAHPHPDHRDLITHRDCRVTFIT